MKPFDANGAYRPEVSGDEVASLAVRGAGMTVLSSAVGLGIQIVGTVLLARLLTPGDFGLVALVTTFSLVLMNFGLNGFTEAILQYQRINHFLISNLFWINVGVGLLLTLAFAAIGPVLALFYHDRMVLNVTVGISPAILMTSVSVQHLALLKRAMRFSALSVNEVAARVFSLLVSIVLAFAGWGYWALVAGAVALPFAQSVGGWYLCRWVPSLPRRTPGTASMVWFAMNVYGRFILNYCSRNVDNLLVGWRFGANSLGFYKKAYDLFALSAGQLSSPLTNVAVSALSRFDPRSREYRQYLISGLSTMAFVGMGLSAVLTLAGQDLIRVLLGPKWEPTGLIFTYFAPGIGAMILYYIHGWIHLSIGRADRWLRWSCVEVSVIFILFLIALPWGASGIAIAWTSSFWLLTVPAFWYAGSPIQLGLKPVLTAVWRYAVAALLASGACLEINRVFHQTGAFPGIAAPLARIVITTVVFCALYAVAVVLLHGGLQPLHELVRLYRQMRPEHKQSDMLPAAVPAPNFSTVGARAKNPDDDIPLVSILIPAYNAEEFIADTLRSALAQTWESTEIIVVDDGSSDETLRIARRFESNRLRVITQENQGAAAARNTAFAQSRGEYIQWLDADDLLAPDKIALQMEAILKHKLPKRVLLSCPFGRFRYRYYRAEFVPTGLWQNLSPTEWLLRKMGENAYMQTATWLVSRELTEAAGPWNPALLGDDDGEYFCRILLASEGVHFVSGAKVYYRAPWVGTLSYVGRSDRKIEAHWCSMRLHIQYLRSLGDSAPVRAACLTYLQAGLIYFYPEKQEILLEAKEIARELGGHLRAPRLLWKYSWIKLIFGWELAKRAETLLPKLRWFVEKCWDRVLFRLSAPSTGDTPYSPE